jgi:ornithine cyclodeaminase
VTELADVLRQSRPGRLNQTEVSIFDSVGFALSDFSALRYLHRLNGELGGEDVIDLSPKLDDPKDLFGGLAPSLPNGAHRERLPASQGTLA